MLSLDAGWKGFLHMKLLNPFPILIYQLIVIQFILIQFILIQFILNKIKFQLKLKSIDTSMKSQNKNQ